MIKFKADSPTGPLIGLGLSAQNLRLLQEGKPIVINLADLGLPPGRVLIFYGETEASMAAEMAAFIGPKTILHGDIS